jgi:putative oxidoreductase
MDEHSTSRWRSAALLVARLLIAALFVHEGFAKLGNYAGSVGYAAKFGVPAALLPAAVALELGGGLLIALGLVTRCASIALAIFCIVTAVVFHRDLGVINQLLHFEKNLAIAGGLLALAVAGPGGWSLGVGRRP